MRRDITCNDIIALHMHRYMALNGCECMVGKSTLRLVFDWMGSVKWDNVQQSRTVDCGKENMCQVSASWDRSPPRVKDPPILVRHSP